jgi:hypothetical protein
VGSRLFTASIVLDDYQNMFMDPRARADLQRRLIEEVKASLPEGLGDGGIFTWSRDSRTNTRTLSYDYILEDVDI